MVPRGTYKVAAAVVVVEVIQQHKSRFFLTNWKCRNPPGTHTNRCRKSPTGAKFSKTIALTVVSPSQTRLCNGDICHQHDNWGDTIALTVIRPSQTRLGSGDICCQLDNWGDMIALTDQVWYWRHLLSAQQLVGYDCPYIHQTRLGIGDI